MWVSIRNDMNSSITCNLEAKNSDEIARVDYIVIENGKSIDIAISNEVDKNPIGLFNQKYGTLKIELEDGTVLNFSPNSDPVNYSLNPFTDNSAWVLTIQDETYSTNTGSTDAKVWNYEFIVLDSNLTD